MNSEMERYVGSGPWSWAVPHSWHVNVFTNPEALQTLYIWDSYGGFIV